MNKITPITVEIEQFVSGPETGKNKLNKYADAIWELQNAVSDLTGAQAGDNTVSGGTKIFVFNNNGVMELWEIGPNGARYIGPVVP